MYLGDVSHPETPVAGQASRVQVAEVVAVNVDDGTIDASPLNGRATKVHVPYPTWWVPQMGERCLLADRDGDPRQPVCLGFLAPADGSNAGPQLQGTIGAASLPKASATALGITKLSVAPASASNPIAVGDNDTRVPTVGEAAALLGTFGTPGSGNKYVTDGDPRNSDSRTPTGAAGGVLAGTYPSPSFAVDMATQAELDAVSAAAVLDGDTAGGDLGSTYPNPTVVKLSATATRFGVAGELRAGSAGVAVMSENYDSVADRQIDNTKPCWRMLLDAGLSDVMYWQRAPATNANVAPTWTTFLSLPGSGVLAAFYPQNLTLGVGGLVYSDFVDNTVFACNYDRLNNKLIDATKSIWEFVVGGTGDQLQAWRAPANPGSPNAAPAFAQKFAVDGTGKVTVFGDLKHQGTNVGFYNVAPAARPAAYTQTYATATRTHSNPTAAAVSTTGATSTTPFGYTTAAQANAIVTAINALVTDVANVKQVLNSVIDDHQANGLLQ